jgi:hypothetical protein
MVPAARRARVFYFQKGNKFTFPKWNHIYCQAFNRETKPEIIETGCRRQRSNVCCQAILIKPAPVPGVPSIVVFIRPKRVSTTYTSLLTRRCSHSLWI